MGGHKHPAGPYRHEPVAPGGVPPLGTPARLAVGIVSAGRVGTAVGEALERVGHVVAAVSARSEASRSRLAARLPEVTNAAPADVARVAELLVLAVPDTALPDVIAELAASGAVGPGHIVVHTAGAYGAALLRPFHRLGAVVAAIHPAMTFRGSPVDTDRLAGCGWGVTAPDEIGQAVGESLVLEMGGRPVRIEEERRALYHAALAHGSNHLVTVVSDALLALEGVIGLPGRAGPAGPDADGGEGMIASGRDKELGTYSLLSHEESLDPDGLASTLLGPLVRAALENTLEIGGAALTGPVMRGDTDTVRRHLAELERADHGIAEGYRAMALRTARKRGADRTLIEAIEDNGPSEPGRDIGR